MGTSDLGRCEEQVSLVCFVEPISSACSCTFLSRVLRRKVCVDVAGCLALKQDVVSMLCKFPCEVPVWLISVCGRLLQLFLFVSRWYLCVLILQCVVVFSQ